MYLNKFFGWRMIMKKLVVLILVLGLATMANAALTLSVGTDTLDPDGVNTTTISISGDGLTPGGSFYLGIDAGSAGTGVLDLDGTITWTYTGGTKNTLMIDDTEAAAAFNVTNPFTNVEMGDYPLPPTVPIALDGLLVSGIGFTCTGVGDVNLMLYDGEINLLDSIVISQVPEPITLALLGLGGLFIRRK